MPPGGLARGAKESQNEAEPARTARQEVPDDPSRSAPPEVLEQLRRRGPETRIAVVGASNDPAKYGNVIVKNLAAKGYTVLPVNPRETEIAGLPAFPNLAAVPAPVHIVNVVTPPAVTKGVLEEAARLGLPAVWLQDGSYDEAVLEVAGDGAVPDRPRGLHHGREQLRSEAPPWSTVASVGRADRLRAVSGQPEATGTDGFREECGVFGIFGHPDAANLTYLGLYALQHRGQEAAGIAAWNGKRIGVEKGMGYVADLFDEARLARLPGTVGDRARPLLDGGRARSSRTPSRSSTTRTRARSRSRTTGTS